MAWPIFGLVLLCSAPAQSKFTYPSLGLYQELREGMRQKKPDMELRVNALLDGVLDGIKMMQAAYVDIGRKPKFCVPQVFDLQPIHLREALDKLLAGNSKLSEDKTVSLGFLVVLALNERFPCDK